jgi:hypothetical protein
MHPAMSPKATEATIAIRNHNGRSSGAKHCLPESRFALPTVNTHNYHPQHAQSPGRVRKIADYVSLPSSPVASKKPNANASTRPTSWTRSADNRLSVHNGVFWFRMDFWCKVDVLIRF